MSGNSSQDSEKSGKRPIVREKSGKGLQRSLIVVN